MLRIIIMMILLHISSAIPTIDDTYDDEPLLFLDSRPSRYKPSRLLQDRDTFYRLSRGRDDNIVPLMDELEPDFQDMNEEFARPTRSQDKTDNFVRFGRGGSNFLRFGRDSYKHRNQDFVRFGRSISESEMPKARGKRDVNDTKKRDRDNFLRFGRRGGDDSFLRYGRKPDEMLPIPTKSNFFGHSERYPFVINKQTLENYPLLALLRKIEEEMRQNN